MPRYNRQFGIDGSLPSTGESAAYSRLSQSLDQFGATADRIGANFVAADARRDAAQLEPSTEAPELHSPATVYGQNYNDIVLEGHLAATRNDYQAQLQGIADQQPLDPVGFTKAAEEIRGAVLQGVSPEIRQAAALDFDRDANSLLRNIQTNQAKAASAEAKASVSDAFDGMESTITRLIRQGDDAGAMEQVAEYRVLIEESEVLTLDEKHDRLAALEKGVIEQGMLADLDELEPGDAFAYLDQAAGDIPASFSPEEWDATIKRAQTILKARVSRQTQIEAATRKAHEVEISDLETKIGLGLGDPEELVAQIERLFDNGKGVITGDERTALLVQIGKRSDEGMEEAALLNSVVDRLKGDNSVIVPPKDIDAIYAKFYAPEIANADKAIFADRMKYVPQPMRKEVVNGLRSGDATLITQAADLLDRLDSLHGIPENTFSTQDRAFASNVADLLHYLPPDEAIKLARQNTDPNDKARIEGRKAAYEEEFKGFTKSSRREKALSEVEDRFDFEIFGNTVDEVARHQLAQDFDALTEDYFVSGMELDKARDQAEQDMLRVWGVDDVTGEASTMRYPPKNYYSVGDDNTWMQEQLKADVAEVWTDPYERLYLRSDGITAREASAGQPSYVVVVKDENGGLNPLIDFGNGIGFSNGGRWRPDRTAALEAQAEETEARGEAFKARRARIVERQTDTPESKRRRELMGPGPATRKALEEPIRDGLLFDAPDRGD